MREGWRRIPLGEVATLGLNRVQVAAGCSYEMAGVYNGGKGVFPRERLSSEGTRYTHLHQLKQGQLVMRKLTAFEGSIGIVPPSLAGYYVSTEFPTFNLDREQVLPEFVALVCQLPSFWNEMWLRSTGTVQRRKRVNPDALLSIEIGLPPLSEQERIVDLIGSLDGVRVTAQGTGEAASDAVQAYIGGFLYDAEGRHPKVTLGEIADVNPEPARFEPDEWIRYVDLGSVTAGSGIDMSALGAYAFADAPSRARRVIRTGDVLVSTVRPNLRGFAVCPPELHGGVASTGFCVLRAKQGVEPGYLWSCVRSDAFVAGLMLRATGSSYPAVRSTDVAAQSFSLPPLDEQTQVAQVIAALDSVSGASLATAVRAQSARDAVLEELLSGERGVPDSYDELLGEAV